MNTQIKRDIKLLIFLWSYEPLYKTILKALSATLLCLIGLTWSFDLAKLYPLITIKQESLALSRIQATGVLFAIFLCSFVFLNLPFRKKYKNYESLSPQEQKTFDKYFKTPSVYEKRGIISV